MIRFTGVGIALLVLGLGADRPLASETSTSSPATDIEVSFGEVLETVDPACLWPVLDTVFSPDAPDAPASVALQGCAPADAEIVLDGDWNRVSLQRGEPGEADFERRFSGARAAHHSEEGWIAVEAYDNWGGSGVFSSLVAGRLAADGAALRDIKVHAFGDRCNGGLAGAAMNAGGRLTASANMTPWDIMIEPFADLPFEAQWEAGKARFGAAFGQASSCAICCSAVTREYRQDDQRGLVAVGLRYDPGTAPSSEDALTVCLEDAVRQAAGADALVEAAERATLGPLIDSCAKSISN